MPAFSPIPEPRGPSQRVMKSPWKFAQHGRSGHWSSDLFPEINRHIDDLCFIHSMHTEGVAHGPATLFLHTGTTNTIRPSMGSWVQYGLGTENANLPGFVSLGPSSGNGGARNYGNAFLPAVYQGTPIGKAGAPVSTFAIRNLGNCMQPPDLRTREYDLIRQINAEQVKHHADRNELDAVIASYELAWRMQSHAPHLLEIARESKETHVLYGIG
jgi:Protein of unknown function (DUF1501)